MGLLRCEFGVGLLRIFGGCEFLVGANFWWGGGLGASEWAANFGSGANLGGVRIFGGVVGWVANFGSGANLGWVAWGGCEWVGVGGLRI